MITQAGFYGNYSCKGKNKRTLKKQKHTRGPKIRRYLEFFDDIRKFESMRCENAESNQCDQLINLKNSTHQSSIEVRSIRETDESSCRIFIFLQSCSASCCDVTIFINRMELPELPSITSFHSCSWLDIVVF